MVTNDLNHSRFKNRSTLSLQKSSSPVYLFNCHACRKDFSVCTGINKKLVKYYNDNKTNSTNGDLHK